jgi:hypothetical protein
VSLSDLVALAGAAHFLKAKRRPWKRQDRFPSSPQGISRIFWQKHPLSRCNGMKRFPGYRSAILALSRISFLFNGGLVLLR